MLTNIGYLSDAKEFQGGSLEIFFEGLIE